MGHYILGFKLTDTHKYPKSNVYNLDLIVTDPNPDLKDSLRRYLNAKINKITNSGLLTLAFNESNTFNTSYMKPSMINEKFLKIQLVKYNNEELEIVNFTIVGMTDSKLQI